MSVVCVISSSTDGLPSDAHVSTSPIEVHWIESIIATATLMDASRRDNRIGWLRATCFRVLFSPTGTDKGFISGNHAGDVFHPGSSVRIDRTRCDARQREWSTERHRNPTRMTARLGTRFAVDWYFERALHAVFDAWLSQSASIIICLPCLTTRHDWWHSYRMHSITCHVQQRCVVL